MEALASVGSTTAKRVAAALGDLNDSDDSGLSHSKGGLNLELLKKMATGLKLTTKTDSRAAVVSALKVYVLSASSSASSSASDEKKDDDDDVKTKGRKKDMLADIEKLTEEAEPLDQFDWEDDAGLSVSKAEARKIKGYSGLGLLWGYWTSPTGEHERYELQTQTDPRIQVFTDLLFRNLANCIVKSKAYILGTDGIGLLRSQTKTLSSLKHGQTGLAVLQTFLKIKHADELMQSLADEPLKIGKQTASFATLVVAARILLSVSAEDWSTVAELSQTWLGVLEETERYLKHLDYD